MAVNARGRFMFVEYSAPTEPVKGQKRRRGGPSEVRAFITQEFHRKMRMKRLGSLKALPLPDRSKGAPLPGEIIEGDGCEGRGDEEVAEEDCYGEAEIETEIESASDISRLLDAPETSSSSTPLTDPSEQDIDMPSSSSSASASASSNVSPHLQTPLGEGRMDPFDVLPISRMPQFIHMVLDHALAHSWPRTVPVRSEALTLNPVRSAWLQCAMEYPVLFHAVIFATTFHLLCLHRGREIAQRAPEWRLFHKVETIKLVNEQLRTLKGAVPSDALIMAVAILSIHGTRDETVYPVVHPLSPLAEAQNLHIYGDLRNDEEHVQGIILLISKKGGLDGIQLYGLADTMQLCDLYFASKYANRPLFPWRRPFESLVTTGKHLLDTVAIDLDSKLGSGFRYLRATPAGQELLEVLQAYSEVTAALDHYTRKGPTAPELVDLIEARNSTQHRLLCQMPAPFDLTDPTTVVLQATRLATLIFSDMVIFPLPTVQGVKPRLALLLQQTLEACTLLGCWELHGQLLIWALTLGAIGASFTSERVWYIDQLLRHVSTFQIQEWSTLEAICSRFLWWKPVCSEPGSRVWEEVFPSTIEET